MSRRAHHPVIHDTRLGKRRCRLEKDRLSQSGGHKGPLEIIDDVFDIIEVATRADQIWGLTPPLMSFLVGELDREEQLLHH